MMWRGLPAAWIALLTAIALVGSAPAPALASSLENRPVAAAGAAGVALPLASLSGLAGNLVSPATGGGNPVEALGAGSGLVAGAAMGAFASGVLGGAGSALRETAHVISRTTAPRLQSTWFSSTYWRVSGLAAVLSLPFLFAAAAQALLRGDPLLLARSAFGYLPLALIGVNLAAPITMLLLAASDQMSAVIAGAGMGGGVHFLQQTAKLVVGLSALDGSPFLGIAIGLLTLAAALALAVEMLIREAAVYVVVLMLPLAFAALIWPARRSWAVRLGELLVALILSKFVIVAVLSLAGAAYGASGTPTATRLLTAMTLVMLSTFAPWVMLRLLPFTEVAAGAAGGIRGELPRPSRIPRDATMAADSVSGWIESLPQLLRRQAGQADGGGGPNGSAESGSTGAPAATERLARGPETAGQGSAGQGSWGPEAPASPAAPEPLGSEPLPPWSPPAFPGNRVGLDADGVRGLAAPGSGRRLAEEPGELEQP
ncbi:MAG TPA: hypothetical protein VFP55_02510 [Solirubrobacteraceae bacterium]|nr:hypothetical protein [Solirubrobacteraceae bacterium]